MGKIFCKNKTRLTLIFICLFLLCSFRNLTASSSEFDLFNEAFENYISYKPLEAIKIFKKFMEEFPESSATDAVMFWLAKSLIQVKSIDEAKKVFSDLEKRFPESLFIPFINKEIKKIKETGLEVYKEKDFEKSEELKTVINLETQIEELKRSLKIQENKLKEVLEENNILKSELSEKDKKIGELQSSLNSLEVVGHEKQNLMDKLSKSIKENESLNKLLEEERSKVKELDKMLKEIQSAKSKYLNEIDELALKLKEEKNKNDALIAKVKELEKREDFIINSTSILNKLGIKDVLWRSGNINDDFINEKILYEEAKNSGIDVDNNKYEELVKKYNLNNGEAEYLKKYMIISKLIKEKFKDTEEEKFVDILTVQYEDKKEEKIVLSRELLSYAGDGMSFENIHKQYPESTTFKTIPLYKLEDWIKERIKSLKNNEIEIIWLKDGYMIIKLLSKSLHLDPLNEPSPLIKEVMRSFVSNWINELKTKN